MHNRPELLARAVRSALEQEPVPEVVIVDDGSDDDTIESLGGLRPAVRVLRSARRSGPSAARNLGAQAASGDWLLFLDSDDVLVAGAVRAFDHLTRGVPVDLALAMASFMDAGSSDRFTGLAGSFVVRRTAFDAVGGYDEALYYGENADLLDRLRDSGRDPGIELTRSDALVSLVTRQQAPRAHDENRLSAIDHLTTTRPSYWSRSVAARSHGVGAVTAARLGRRWPATRHAVRAVGLEPWRPRHYLRLASILVWPIGRRRWSR